MTKGLQTKEQKGLYQSDYEHDACGVGMVVNIHGGKSHELVDNALKVLENMEHRGAETRDKTGDGAGIMVQIPHEFILLQGIPVPEKGKYGTGLVFLPKDKKAQEQILSVMIEEIEREDLQLMHVRTVPTCPEVLGVGAREVEPDIMQIFVTGVSEAKAEILDRILYKVRSSVSACSSVAPVTKICLISGSTSRAPAPSASGHVGTVRTCIRFSPSCSISSIIMRRICSCIGLSLGRNTIPVP